MVILNLGCGLKTATAMDVVNIDWSFYLRMKRSRVLSHLVPIFARGERRARFDSIADNIVVHNLAKGIPFADASVDVVYHSHMLEHLDRHVAEAFLVEALRVLRPGGIHRIVVPDLEQLCRAYLAHLAGCDSGHEKPHEHDEWVAALLEQTARKEAARTAKPAPMRRKLENVLLGDARKRGETHQWMYDRVNLTEKLSQAGFRAVTVCDFDQSTIPDWNRRGLDLNAEGKQYKPHSLYLEAVK